MFKPTTDEAAMESRVFDGYGPSSHVTCLNKRLIECCIILLLRIVTFFCFQLATEKKKMVCYYGSWAVYRPGNGKFDVENIDPFLCTHIVYGFAGLALDNTINVLDPYNDLKENWGKGAYLRFTGLKKQNPDLKALIAVGGNSVCFVSYRIENSCVPLFFSV